MSCPKCNDTHGSFIIKEITDKLHPGRTRTVAVRCECFYEKRKASLIKQSRIPEQYVNGFSEYHEDYYGADPSLAMGKLAAMQMVEKYPLEKFGLLFVGPLGVGKTHLACAALRELINKGIAGLFYSYADLLSEIRATYNDTGSAKYYIDEDGNRWETESQILNHVINVEVLLLDELGKVKATDWVLDKIREIIGGRYDKKRTTLITTNFPLNAPLRVPGAGAQLLLQDKIGADMVSRLREMCHLVEMRGIDYRARVNR